MTAGTFNYSANHTPRFDKASLDKIIERVADLPDPQLDPAVNEAFDVPFGNIYALCFARKAPHVKVQNMKGVGCKRVSRCITSMSLYVPGGTAVYLHEHSCLRCASVCTDCRMQNCCSGYSPWEKMAASAREGTL